MKKKIRVPPSGPELGAQPVKSSLRKCRQIVLSMAAILTEFLVV